VDAVQIKVLTIPTDTSVSHGISKESFEELEILHSVKQTLTVYVCVQQFLFEAACLFCCNGSKILTRIGNTYTYVKERNVEMILTCSEEMLERRILERCSHCTWQELCLLGKMYSIKVNLYLQTVTQKLSYRKASEKTSRDQLIPQAESRLIMCSSILLPK
jgi:hypothetical protein